MFRGGGRGGRGGRKRRGGGPKQSGRYWNKPQRDNDEHDEDQSEKMRPPPGLRGKALGLFYRDRQRSKQPKEKASHTEPTLAIPPVVFQQVANLIKNIKEIAKRHNIKVNYVSRQKKFELLTRIKQEQECVMDLDDCDNDDVVITDLPPEVLVIDSDDEDEDLDIKPLPANLKVETVSKDVVCAEGSATQPGTSKSNFVKGEIQDMKQKFSDSSVISELCIPKVEKDVTEPEPSVVKPTLSHLTLSAAENFLQQKKLELANKNKHTTEVATFQTNISPTNDFLAKKKQDLIRKREAHKSSWNKDLPTLTNFSELRAEVKARVNPVSTPHFKGSEDFVPFCSPSKLNEPVVAQPEKQVKESEYIPFSVPSGMSAISTMPDFIPVKKEAHILTNEGASSSCGPERVLSLREKYDFKYSYHDIITSSFNEKLDQELAKGITIRKSTEDIKKLSEKFYTEHQGMVQDRKYKEMLKFRQKLPAYNKAAELLEVINSSSVVVISGETGCGKSTQVPQIILDEAILAKKGANTKILVTQPRRIAASSLAERVAAERAESMGNTVGYAVRLEKQDARPRGSIMFVTTGILLTEIEINQGLTGYSHIVLDEVHERDTNVDLSMMILKEILKKRKDLKVILMSATLNAEALSEYFENCPVVHIEGLAYPVQDIYLEEIYRLIHYTFEDLPELKPMGRQSQPAFCMQKDVKHRAEVGRWVESIKREIDHSVYKVLLDHRSEVMQIDVIFRLLIYLLKGPPGAILVFLPGIGEISKLVKAIEESEAFPSSRFRIFPLHSKLPSLEQNMIFERPPDGIRKIIVATNIAETSITIDDVVYVIDCGRVKLSGLNVKENIQTLQVEWASKANLHQRRGRAGRCQPGICYHLVTSFRASQLDERLLPELQRSNLLEAVLMIKQQRLGKAEEALGQVLDPPHVNTVKWAVKHLQQIGALDVEEILTPLGWHLARLPVHPAAGKLMLLGALFGCLDRAASVAAVWGFKDPFMMVLGKEPLIDQAKSKLALGEPSDQVALSEAIISWERTYMRDKKEFCYDHFLSNKTLELLSEMKHQFGDNLRQMGFLPSGDVRAHWENRNRNNLSLFKALVAAALYPNVAKVKWSGLHRKNRPPSVTAYTDNGRTDIHPSSICAPRLQDRFPVPKKWQERSTPGANWLVYWLQQKSTSLFLLEVTLVYSLPLLFFGELDVTYDEKYPDDCFLSIATNKVRCDLPTADLLFELRSMLDHVLASKVSVGSEHSARNSEFENEVLNAVIELITAEDEQVQSMEECASDSDYEYESKNNQRNWRIRN